MSFSQSALKRPKLWFWVSVDHTRLYDYLCIAGQKQSENQKVFTELRSYEYTSFK